MNDTSKLVHVSWNEIQVEEMNPLLLRQYICGANITVARVQLKKGAIVARHSHDNEQVTCVLEGALTLRFPDREVTLRPGEILCIPGHLPHEAEARKTAWCSTFLARRAPTGWPNRMRI